MYYCCSLGGDCVTKPDVCWDVCWDHGTDLTIDTVIGLSIIPNR